MRQRHQREVSCGFMGPAVELLGKEQFVAVFTSLASYVHKVGTARVGFS